MPTSNATLIMFSADAGTRSIVGKFCLFLICSACDTNASHSAAGLNTVCSVNTSKVFLIEIIAPEMPLRSLLHRLYAESLDTYLRSGSSRRVGCKFLAAR